MGWDAYAQPNRLTKAQHDEFRRAATTVKRRSKGSGVDGYLIDGALDCSDSGSYLADITGENVYVEWPWSKEMVKVLADTAKRMYSDPKVWNIEDDRLWAFWSAYYFLMTCAKLGKGIKFSY